LGNGSRLSQLMRDELAPPKEVAAYWVEHVLKHGGTKHLQSKAKDMPFYKLYMLDVWLFLMLILMCTLLIFYKFFAYMIKMFTSKKKKTE
jgi:glucuronosyltransferase